MATNKPRFSITLDDDLFDRVNKYQHEKRYATQTKAVVDLIQRGMESLGLSIDEQKNKPTIKKSPNTTKVALGDDVFRIFDALTATLVSAGLIQDGEEITEKQSEVLLAICRIIDATFKD